MKYKIGQLVREGGPHGPIVRIVNIIGNQYVTNDIDPNRHSTGYMEEEYLFPYKEYEQLKLF